MASGGLVSKGVVAAGLGLVLAVLAFRLLSDPGELKPAEPARTPVPAAVAKPVSDESTAHLLPPSPGTAEASPNEKTPPSPRALRENEAHASRESGSTQEWIRERYEAAQVERAAIKSAANREHRKLNVEERIAYWEVEARLIEEIGADAYDELLYENGRENRSRVHWLAAGSSPAEAGIQRGDILVSYGEWPAFGPRSVREANRLFEPGEQLVVVVDRDGQLLEFVVDADPLWRGRSGIVNGMTLLPLAMEP